MSKLDANQTDTIQSTYFPTSQFIFNATSQPNETSAINVNENYSNQSNSSLDSVQQVIESRESNSMNLEATTAKSSELTTYFNNEALTNQTTSSSVNISDSFEATILVFKKNLIKESSTSDTTANLLEVTSKHRPYPKFSTESELKILNTFRQTNLVKTVTSLPTRPHAGTITLSNKIEEINLSSLNSSFLNHFISQLDTVNITDHEDSDETKRQENETKRFKSEVKTVNNIQNYETIKPISPLTKIDSTVKLTTSTLVYLPSPVQPTATVFPTTIYDLISFSNIHFIFIIILMSVSFLILIVLLVKVTLIQWNFTSFVPFERQTDDIDYLSQTNNNETVMTGIRYFSDEESFLINYNRNELIRAFQMFRMSTNRLKKSMRNLGHRNNNQQSVDAIESITYL